MSRFSVIVPALNEADRIGAALTCARRALGKEAELIVVDGGSHDGTDRVAAARATVLRGERGRGRQMNTGARAACGEVLLFLHADTRLAPGTGARILACLEDPGVVGGCCRFGVDPPPSGLDRFRLLELGVNLRTRLFRSATGDQAIFARAEAFRAVGGFPAFPLFEDVVLVRRLRRHGRFRPVDAVARTSRRRWEGEGFWRTIALHWLLRAAFWAGVSPDRLAARYGRRVSRSYP